MTPEQREAKQLCNDFGDEPLCQRYADPRWVMDLGGGCLIHWCAFCGPQAKKMHDWIVDGLKRPGFAAALRERLVEERETRFICTKCGYVGATERHANCNYSALDSRNLVTNPHPKKEPLSENR